MSITTITTKLINGSEKTFNFAPEKVSGYTIKQLTYFIDKEPTVKDNSKKKHAQNVDFSHINKESIELGLMQIEKTEQRTLEAIISLMKLSWFISEEDFGLINTKDFNLMFDKTKETFFT